MSHSGKKTLQNNVMYNINKLLFAGEKYLHSLRESCSRKYFLPRLTIPFYEVDVQTRVWNIRLSEN